MQAIQCPGGVTHFTVQPAEPAQDAHLGQPVAFALRTLQLVMAIVNLLNDKISHGSELY